MKHTLINGAAFALAFIFFKTTHTGDFDKTYYQEKTKDMICFESDGTPKPHFLGLLETLRPRHLKTKEYLAHDGTRQSVLQMAQDAFYHGSVEHYQIKDDPAYPLKTVQPLLEKLGVLRAYAPPKKEYKSAIFFDGNMLWDRERQSMLIDTWNTGTRFESVHICTGNHLFDPHERYKREDYFELDKYGLKKRKAFNENWWNPLGKTDEYILHMFFNQVEMPPELLQVDKHLVVSEVNPETGARPNTESNARGFLACECRPSGMHLGISNGPHVPYQKIVSVYTLLKARCDTVQVDVVGRKDPGDLTAIQHLDRASRLAYVESAFLDELGSIK